MQASDGPIGILFHPITGEAVAGPGWGLAGKSTLVQLPELEAQGRQYLTFDDPDVLEVGGLGSPFLHPGFCPALK